MRARDTQQQRMYHNACYIWVKTYIVWAEHVVMVCIENQKRESAASFTANALTRRQIEPVKYWLLGEDGVLVLLKVLTLVAWVITMRIRKMGFSGLVLTSTREDGEGLSSLRSNRLSLPKTYHPQKLEDAPFLGTYLHLVQAANSGSRRLCCFWTWSSWSRKAFL